jgi:hypothetical protein
MTNLVGFTPERALTANITAEPGAQARFYQTGTMTPVTVRDVDGNILAQPVLANAAGIFQQVTYDGTLGVKAIVTAADDSSLYTIDPCPLNRVGGSGAASISFTPVTGVIATNVQDAIVEVQGNIDAQTANIQTLVQTGGSGGAYTLTAVETITAYVAGQAFLIRINHENTGASTLDVDGLGPRDLQKYSGGSLVALAVADLRVGDTVVVVFDGTRFVVIFGLSGIVRTAISAAQTAAEGRDFAWSQTWQVVTGSRTAGTSYQNTTGRPISVAILASSGTTRDLQVSTDNSTWIGVGRISSAGGIEYQTFVVPEQHYYRINGAATINTWSELR